LKPRRTNLSPQQWAGKHCSQSAFDGELLDRPRKFRLGSKLIERNSAPLPVNESRRLGALAPSHDLAVNFTISVDEDVGVGW
jgi:hypothetical protein